MLRVLIACESSGVERDALDNGAAFFALMFRFKTPRLAIENPVQHKYAIARHGQGKPTQTIQPYQFGHMETKRTCYWLRGLPPLKPTTDLRAETFALPPSERGRIHYASPGPDRWRLRSRSYVGIANAMAEQWGAAAVAHHQLTHERRRP